MGLLEIDVRPSLRSDADDLVRELYVPALLRSRLYWRASGFFSSSIFRIAVDGFEPFFAAGGRMLLVTSPVLSIVDADAVGRGLIERDVADLPTGVDALFEELRARRIGTSDVLRYLLHSGQLVMSVALRERGRHGIYHEKFGLFEDEDRQRLLMTGSANESENALVRNFERVETYRSWGSEEERRAVGFGRDQFRRLLAGQTDGLRIKPLFRAYLEGSLKVTDSDGWMPPVAHGRERAPLSVEEILVPSQRVLYTHQEEAIRAWARDGKGRGVLAMATGSGKTVTALSLAARVYDLTRASPLAVMIVAPLIHLVDQWCENARDFGLDPIRCAEGTDRWRPELEAAISALNSGRRRVLSVATTQQTLLSPTFRAALSKLDRPMLLIGDEAHNYGAPAIAEALPDATYRVGLSATPERWLDPEGTKAVHAYFGDTVYEYGLERAIADGVLTPYDYDPVLVALVDEEREQYIEISAKLARYGFDEESQQMPEAAKRLLIRRARIVASAKEKLPRLRALMARDPRATHVLVYCGDGLVDTDEAVTRQIDEVVRIVSEDLGMTCARYVADTPPTRRRELLELFDQGEVQVLVAIRCLDEGVDVPSTRTAYILASSSNPRQFVQRRGRVLRLSPRTGKSVAEIHDFFVIPPIPESGTEDDAAQRSMRRMFGRQLGRAGEFSGLARNGPAARAPLFELSKRFGLLGEWAS